jgi:hypothetical protein
MKTRILLAGALVALGLVAMADTTWVNNDVQTRGPSTLQNAATTGNGTVLKVNGTTKETAIYVTWSAHTTGGVVTLEASDDAAYAGTWAPLATVTWAAASTKILVMVTGSVQNIRARISSNVTNDGTAGTVTVTAYGTN